MILRLALHAGEGVGRDAVDGGLLGGCQAGGVKRRGAGHYLVVVGRGQGMGLPCCGEAEALHIAEGNALRRAAGWSLLYGDVVDVDTVGGAAARSGLNHDGHILGGGVARHQVEELLVAGAHRAAILLLEFHEGAGIGGVAHQTHLDSARCIVAFHPHRDLLAGQTAHLRKDGILVLRVVVGIRTIV